MQHHWLSIIPLIFAAVILVIAVIVGLIYRSRQKRIAAWQTAAEQMGLTYFGKENDLLERFASFRLFHSGDSRKIRQGIQGDAGDLAITLADFHYSETTSSSDGSSTSYHAMTVCIVCGSALQLPCFSLHAQVIGIGFLRKLAASIQKLFHCQPIAFDDDPEFSAAYTVRGDDEPAIRELFDAGTRAWFTAQKGRWQYLEGRPQCFVFHKGKLLPPEGSHGLLGDALELCQVVSPTAKA